MDEILVHTSRPSSVATVLQPRHYNTTTLQHCNTTTQHYNTDFFQGIANLASFFLKIEKFDNFWLTNNSRLPNSHWKLSNWQYFTRNRQKSPNWCFFIKNHQFGNFWWFLATYMLILGSQVAKLAIFRIIRQIGNSSQKMCFPVFSNKQNSGKKWWILILWRIFFANIWLIFKFRHKMMKFIYAKRVYNFFI